MPTEPVFPESELLLRVQQRIKDGRLPVAVPALISAGYGTGTDVCRVCDLAVSGEQTMYEINDPRNSEPLAFSLRLLRDLAARMCAPHESRLGSASARRTWPPCGSAHAVSLSAARSTYLSRSRRTS